MDQRENFNKKKVVLVGMIVRHKGNKSIILPNLSYCGIFTSSVE